MQAAFVVTLDLDQTDPATLLAVAQLLFDLAESENLNPVNVNPQDRPSEGFESDYVGGDVGLGY